MLLLAIIFLVLLVVSAVLLWAKHPDSGPWGTAVLVMLGILGWVAFAGVLAGR